MAEMKNLNRLFTLTFLILFTLIFLCSCSSTVAKCVAPELIQLSEKEVAKILKKVEAPKVINYSTGEEEPVDYSKFADPKLIEDLILGGIKAYQCWKQIEETK